MLTSSSSSLPLRRTNNKQVNCIPALIWACAAKYFNRLCGFSHLSLSRIRSKISWPINRPERHGVSQPASPCHAHNLVRIMTNITTLRCARARTEMHCMHFGPASRRVYVCACACVASHKSPARMRCMRSLRACVRAICTRSHGRTPAGFASIFGHNSARSSSLCAPLSCATTTTVAAAHRCNIIYYSAIHKQSAFVSLVSRDRLQCPTLNHVNR